MEKMKFFLIKVLKNSLIRFLLVLVISVGFISLILKIIPFQNYVIITESMSPKIDPGDLVVLKTNVSLKDLNKGDIIGFREDLNNSGEEEIVVHFVHEFIEDENEKLYLETISNVSSLKDDWKVYEEDLEGIMLFSVPSVGKLSFFFSSNIGRVFLFFNAATIIIVYETVTNEAKRKKDKKDKIKKIKKDS